MPPSPTPLYGQKQHGQPWRTSGYAPHPVKHKPYADKLFLENVLPSTVDKAGVRVYEQEGKRFYHPVVIAQYALAQLDVATRTNDAEAMDAAVANASKLLDVADSHKGGLYFPYRHDFALGGLVEETIHGTWWSAMAQGQALSLFVRLYQATGNKSWRDAADKTFATLDDRGPRERPWAVYVDPQDYLRFEEYAGDTRPLLVLNGHIFAIFGVWDYYRLTRSAKAEELFDAGVTTLREYLPAYRAPGDISYYCMRAPLCQRKLWQNEKYHGIVIDQMRVIADMSDDQWFNRQADVFTDDFAG